MSKLVKLYKQLKEKDSENLYLFKSGIFYIFLDKDAQKISNYLGLKLTNLNSDILKCGFPQNSLTKYITLLNSSPFTIKIVDNNSMFEYSISDFTIQNDYLNIFNQLSNINIENLSVKEAFELISDLQKKSQKILEQITNEKNIERSETYEQKQ